MKKSGLHIESSVWPLPLQQRQPMRGQGTIEYHGRPGGHLRTGFSFPLARPTPRPLPKRRGQGTIEYILILAASLMVVALVTYFLMNNVFVPQTQTLGNQSDQIKDFKKQLQQQGDADQPTPTPTPTGPPPGP